MRQSNYRLIGGLALILLGGVLLFQNIGFLQPGDLFWGVLFLLTGIFLFSRFFYNRQNWWLLIPGYLFVGISCLLFMGVFFPNAEDTWGGSIILAVIGLAFITIFIIEKQNWWAIIPAGVLLTLSIISGLDHLLKDNQVGGLLFVGIGMTLAILPLLPISQKQDMKWAWIPAGILFVIGLFIIGFNTGLIQIIGSILLILLGGFFILRIIIKRA